MNLLLKSANIIDSSSEFHNTVQDILIEKGVISNIAKNIENPNNYKEINLENLHVSQGWFDSSVCFGEPGFEDRETIANGLKTAALSGFTAVAMNADTHPVLDSSSDIAFVKSKAQNHAVHLLPIGALTNNSDGEHLSEMFDMKNAGACAFQDYKKPITNANMLKIALQYASNFNGLVYSYPQDNSITRSGVVNENITSTKLGLKGNPNLAEALQVARDLFLLEYTNGKLHIPTISTAEAVDLIREAKKKKLDVSCSVAIHNLFFTDEVLTSFDTKYKVQPPLRTKKDVEALIEGVKDGTIDMVTSDHNPLNIELKNIEFDYASYGTIGLESAFGVLNSLFSTKKTISLLTKGKDRFGIENTSISIGNKANMSLFNPNHKYTFEKSHIHSKSKNSIFLNTELKGSVYGIIANKKMILNA
ncbi:dihydroorotase family protein [Oceanihabitans sediminis]|uniref:Dihydroorotase n=1 Tax=Oceanihabitans sediminis TaxID=1812012 RepID=A0A368P6Z8_9FLAO|nr:dihydroorotase [Oceanihabitans sediminis]MDX1277566.1 dihydroorotase [Oceanihabitans sediminis]RBP32918.1 dihydroorotase [Oceanihabitans sediminis]RCU57559.1 dihydroorotase [Oceanihabitans sediminis]